MKCIIGSTSDGQLLSRLLYIQQQQDHRTLHLPQAEHNHLSILVKSNHLRVRSEEKHMKIRC